MNKAVKKLYAFTAGVILAFSIIAATFIIRDGYEQEMLAQKAMKYAMEQAFDDEGRAHIGEVYNVSVNAKGQEKKKEIVGTAETVKPEETAVNEDIYTEEYVPEIPEETYEAEESAENQVIDEEADQLGNGWTPADMTIAEGCAPDSFDPGIYEYSQEDAYLLACVVAAEAGNSPYETQLAVANVILDRAANAGSIKDAVYAEGQFAITQDGTLDKFIASGPTVTAAEAAQNALYGEDYRSKAYYYYNNAVNGHSNGEWIGDKYFFLLN